MTEKRKVQSAIAEHIAKLSEAIFRVRGYSIDIDEIKDYIKTAISALDNITIEDAPEGAACSLDGKGC